MVVVPGREVELELATRITVETSIRIFGANATADDVASVAKAAAEISKRVCSEFLTAGLLREAA